MATNKNSFFTKDLLSKLKNSVSKKSIEKPVYICLDVESPNCHNDSICQIGMVYLDENFNVIKVVDELIDPECNFDGRNIGIHHITPDMVKGKMKFDEFWNIYKHDICNSIIVCHNKSYDINVLNKSVLSIGECLNETILCVDTMCLCERDNSFSGRSLGQSCEALGLQTGQEHCAKDDALMCSELFKYYNNQNF